MIKRRIVQCLLFLSTLCPLSLFADECIKSSSKKDPALAMREMRILSMILEDQRRLLGVYPAADGEFHRLRDVLEPGAAGRVTLIFKDVWGHPIWYRANAEVHQLVSYGSDGIPDEDYAAQRLHAWPHAPIVESPTSGGDLVLLGGRFVRRPFAGLAREMATINAINAIFAAAAPYAVDYYHYPGSASSFSSVTELIPEMVPVYIQDLPALDGWGRQILYANVRGSFWLVSFGEDGLPDRQYLLDLPCGLEDGPSIEPGGDVVQTCGVLRHWPRGTEP